MKHTALICAIFIIDYSTDWEEPIQENDSKTINTQMSCKVRLLLFL